MTAGPEHPIRVDRDPATGEPAPYVHVRRGLEALIDRKSFYRLVELGDRATATDVRRLVRRRLLPLRTRPHELHESDD